MGRMQNVESPQAEAVSERLERFAHLQPENAEANYYYALDLRRWRKGPDDPSTSRVEGLLQRAVRLEPKFSEAYLQLGILYAEQRNFPQAVAAYRRAIEANPRQRLKIESGKTTNTTMARESTEARLNQGNRRLLSHSAPRTKIAGIATIARRKITTSSQEPAPSSFLRNA